MKNKTQILILFLILLVIPISTVFECANSYNKEKTKKTSCSKVDSQSKKNLCCDNHKKDEDDCNGSCDNIFCHCPTTINIPVVFYYFQLSNTNHVNLLNNEWTYVQQNPKAVYLSIWHPPKIS